MQAVGKENDEVEEEQQHKMFPLSFAAVVKSTKFLEAVAEKDREGERLKKERREKKESEDKKREDEKKIKEDARIAKLQERKIEDEARCTAQLAELAKSLETATLHKKYVKNLHDQAHAQAKETEGYEAGIEKMKRWRDQDEGKEGDGGKRLASCSAEETPLAKKQIPIQ